MAIVNSPPSTPVDTMDMEGNLKPPSEGWRAFFSAVYNATNALTMSGTTANRPVTFIYVGRPYFDTTLGIPIWVKTTNPTVWVNATGAVV